MELADKDFKIAIITVFSNETSGRVRLKWKKETRGQFRIKP